MQYYIGDTHFGHANIIEYCNRPFESVGAMDAEMADAIRRVDTPTNHIFHVGDFVFRVPQWYRKFGELKYPERNTLVLGNHDRVTDAGDLRKLQTWFRHVVGTRETWRTNSLVVADKLPAGPVRVLLSHLPQRNLHGCDYNIYGHFHNNLYTQPGREKDWLWALEDTRYLNAGVEITNYMPMTLGQLIQANEEALVRVW